MKKIILDTDIGDDVDDALALSFALLCGEIEIARRNDRFPGHGPSCRTGLLRPGRAWKGRRSRIRGSREAVCSIPLSKGQADY